MPDQGRPFSTRAAAASLAISRMALSRTGQDDDAAQLLRAAVDKAPGDWSARRALGETLLKQEKPAEALPHLRLATQPGPDDLLAWLALAEAHRLLGQVGEAESACAKAIELNPHNDAAERARRGSSQLAETGFQRSQRRSATDGGRPLLPGRAQTLCPALTQRAEAVAAGNLRSWPERV